MMNDIHTGREGKPALSSESVAALTALVGRLGKRGLVGLAEGYLGPLAERARENATRKTHILDSQGEPKSGDAFDERELAVLGMAVSKLVFELGELSLHNPSLASDGKQPVFALDENGRAPALSVAYLLTAARLWTSNNAAGSESKALEGPALTVTSAALPMSARSRLYSAQSQYYASAPRYAYVSARAEQPSQLRDAAPSRSAYVRPVSPNVSRGANMATYSSSSRGCASCGGSSRPSSPSAPTPYDPCAAGLVAPPRATEAGCGCGSCGCHGASTASPSKTYDAAACPTFAISCETKQLLRDCAKTALCDFLRCVSDTLCPDGRFDADRLNSTKNPELAKSLVDCVGQLACSFIHCVPEALCPPPACGSQAAPIDCLPCGYAVESKP